MPFAFHDVVEFLPLFAREHISRGHHFLLVTGCHNYGTEEQPNYAVDGQYLREHEYDPEVLVLTPTQVFMVAAWQVKKVDRAWER